MSIRRYSNSITVSKTVPEAKVPYIGEDNIWYEWDSSSNQYVSTGVVTKIFTVTASSLTFIRDNRNTDVTKRNEILLDITVSGYEENPSVTVSGGTWYPNELKLVVPYDNYYDLITVTVALGTETRTLKLTADDITEKAKFFGTTIPNDTKFLYGDSYFNTTSNTIQVYGTKWESFSDSTVDEDYKALILAKAQKTVLSTIDENSITSAGYGYFKTVISDWVRTTNLSGYQIFIQNGGKIAGGEYANKYGEYIDGVGFELGADGVFRTSQAYINKSNAKDLKIDGDSTFNGTINILDSNNKSLLKTNRKESGNSTISTSLLAPKYWSGSELIAKLGLGTNSYVTYENQSWTKLERESSSASSVTHNTAVNVNADYEASVSMALNGSGFVLPCNANITGHTGSVPTNVTGIQSKGTKVKFSEAVATTNLLNISENRMYEINNGKLIYNGALISNADDAHPYSTHVAYVSDLNEHCGLQSTIIYVGKDLNAGQRLTFNFTPKYSGTYSVSARFPRAKWRIRVVQTDNSSNFWQLQGESGALYVSGYKYNYFQDMNLIEGKTYSCEAYAIYYEYGKYYEWTDYSGGSEAIIISKNATYDELCVPQVGLYGFRTNEDLELIPRGGLTREIILSWITENTLTVNKVYYSDGTSTSVSDNSGNPLKLLNFTSIDTQYSIRWKPYGYNNGLNILNSNGTSVELITSSKYYNGNTTIGSVNTSTLHYYKKANIIKDVTANTFKSGTVKFKKKAPVYQEVDNEPITSIVSSNGSFTVNNYTISSNDLFDCDNSGSNDSSYFSLSGEAIAEKIALITGSMDANDESATIGASKKYSDIYCTTLHGTSDSVKVSWLVDALFPVGSFVVSNTSPRTLWSWGEWESAGSFSTGSTTISVWKRSA